MSVRQNIPRHRPDGGHGPSGRTTVRTDFPKFPPRNSRTSAASNFLIRLSSVRTMGDECPEGRTSTASNFLIRLSSIRTMGDERPDGYSSTRRHGYGFYRRKLGLETHVK
jgi:hypothetical protein